LEPPGKTGRFIGFAAGVVAGVFTAGAQAALQAALGVPFSIVPFSIADHAQWLWVGLGFGVGAMSGDCLKSLVKRRLGIAPGAPWIPFDQLDFAVGALALTAWSVDLSPRDILAILTMNFIGDIIVNRIAWKLGIKSSPW
jgi:CDP-2,3-bis-(O-geranylgeranyl)-sn-glycerol synthase